jgi:hypothetical protein
MPPNLAPPPENAFSTFEVLDRQGQSMRTTTGSGSYERFGLGVGDDSCLSTK